jgi:hypothetical protein
MHTFEDTSSCFSPIHEMNIRGATRDIRNLHSDTCNRKARPSSLLHPASRADRHSFLLHPLHSDSGSPRASEKKHPQPLLVCERTGMYPGGMSSVKSGGNIRYVLTLPCSLARGADIDARHLPGINQRAQQPGTHGGRTSSTTGPSGCVLKVIET